MNGLVSLEICAGAGGQALGLEWAGFEHAALVEIESGYCTTLKFNRPSWRVIQSDLREFDGRPFKGVDLLAGGVPCPPFSVAGKQLGKHDERDLFPEALRLVREIRPRAVMLENVKGLLEERFRPYRSHISEELGRLGYRSEWRLVNASHFGVPQLRPRVVLVALSGGRTDFRWPEGPQSPPPTVGEALYDLMAAHGWRGAKEWRLRANSIAPTLVGGSLKHGGPDLGPSRAKKAWALLGVDGNGLAGQAPAPDFEGTPRLTVRMAARLQGFPDDWHFCGGKTIAYKQVGNAFPPPVAKAVGFQIRAVLLHDSQMEVAL